MTEPINFSEEKMKRSGDGRDWTPLDTLKALVRDIEAGDEPMPTLMYVCMQTDSPGTNNSRVHFACSGGSKTEMLGLLMKHVFNFAPGGGLDL